MFVHGNESAETFRRNVVHHDGVRRVVAFEHHDYADVDVPVLMRMLAKRKKGYAALGYKF